MTAVNEDETEFLKARIRDLETALNQNNPYIPIVFQLSPALANLLGLLLSVPYASTEMIEHRLELADNVRMAIKRLRLKTEPFGIVINSRRTLGYWLDAGTKAKILSILADARQRDEAISSGQYDETLN